MSFIPISQSDPAYRNANDESADHDEAVRQFLSDAHKEWPNKAGVNLDISSFHYKKACTTLYLILMCLVLSSLTD
jgi:hypothetical protein